MGEGGGKMIVRETGNSSNSLHFGYHYFLITNASLFFVWLLVNDIFYLSREVIETVQILKY